MTLHKNNIAALKRRRRRQLRKGMSAHLTSLVPETWNEDTTQWRPIMYLDAATFRQQPIFDIPPAEAGNASGDYLLSPEHSFAYSNSVLPKHRPLTTFGSTNGLVFFSERIVIPTLLGLDRNRRGKPFPEDVPARKRVPNAYVWMSLTPNEVLSQRGGVEAAEGTVVIGGLGLGWLLRKICEKDSVDRVVIVELSQELLDWYGYDLCAKYSKVSDVICDDIYNQIGRHGSRAMHVLDIWPILAGASQDPQLRQAKRQYGDRLWAWGENYRTSYVNSMLA